MGDDYAEKAARAAKMIRQNEKKKPDGQRRLDQARLAQIRFDYLDRVQQGQADTRRRHKDERYLG